jgi:hypothetical protein
MNVFILPAWVALVRVKTPAQNEMLTAVISFLHGAHCLLDQFAELPVRFVTTLVGGISVLGVGFHPGQRRSPLAL